MCFLFSFVSSRVAHFRGSRRAKFEKLQSPRDYASFGEKREDTKYLKFTSRLFLLRFTVRRESRASKNLMFLLEKRKLARVKMRKNCFAFFAIKLKKNILHSLFYILFFSIAALQLSIPAVELEKSHSLKVNQ